MGDREARAVGAGMKFTVNRKDYRLSPVSIGLLDEVQREAFRSYKRTYLQTYLDIQDSLPPSLIEKKIEEVAKWDMKCLPNQKAYSCKEVPINETVDAKLAALYGEAIYDKTAEESTKRTILTTALDEGKITPQEVAQWTGVRPREGVIPYDLWWVTATHEGQIVFVWASLQRHHPGISRVEIGGWNTLELIQAANMVQELTQPDVGNT